MKNSFLNINKAHGCCALVYKACDLDFQGFAIGVTSQEMPAKLIEEADFTLDGVNDVERFLSWLSQVAVNESYS